MCPATSDVVGPNLLYDMNLDEILKGLPGQMNSQQAPQLTTRGWFENWLYQHGIFETQAAAIMDYVIQKVDAQLEAAAQPGETGYKITWDRPASEYPESFYGVMILTQKIKQHVYDWAEQNMPLAFWKPMFSPNFKVPGQ